MLLNLDAQCLMKFLIEIKIFCFFIFLLLQKKKAIDSLYFDELFIKWYLNTLKI